MPPRLSAVAGELDRLGRGFYARGWVLGTSGNFSAILSRRPLRLALTASGVSKGAIGARDLVVVGPTGRAVGAPRAKPSAEALLHVTIALARSAGAVLHTHSIWSTILSDMHGADGGLRIAGYEMLKGLEGVGTHEHSEWLPILDNDQDMTRLAATVQATLIGFPAAHGFLLRRHGLYTWGGDLRQAGRHVEILEFLLEASGRTRMMVGPRAGGSHGPGENS